MKVLFLSTWFPYPLSHGSKIRAYYLLRALAQRHNVTLVSFADAFVEPDDLTHVSNICRRVEVVRRSPFASNRLRAGLGWLSLQPRSISSTYSPEMDSLVEGITTDWRPDRIVALTLHVARYAAMIPGITKVVDIDYAMTLLLHEIFQRTKHLPSRIRKWLAYAKTRFYEKWLYRQFDFCLVASNRDRLAVADYINLPVTKIGVVANGVDAALCQAVIKNPTPATLVYNGALTWLANYDAVLFFLKEIYPLIRAAVPDVQLKITGSTTGVNLSALHADDHVTYTGYLDDIRPVVSSSSVCIVPLRIGGGTRLKILEAMALGTPVVSTTKGIEGLDVEDGKHVLVADTPEAFSAQVLRLLRDPSLGHMITTSAKQLITEKYNWTLIGRHFCDLVENA